ncbi:Uncharacterised protein [Streptococcus dysgalactiae subsp. equisimilis]|nr:Uncharacterised protein [Streptococcus dysgalactiae subsp. equisimilis]
MITRLQVLDTGTDTLDNTGSLMAQDDWHRHIDEFVSHRNVRMADTGGNDAHHHFVESRRVQFQRKNL